jgi:uncharacterized protein YvpB
MLQWIQRNNPLGIILLMWVALLILSLLVIGWQDVNGVARVPSASSLPSPPASTTPIALPTRSPTPSPTETQPPTNTAKLRATATVTPALPAARILSVPVVLQELPLSCEFAGMRMVASALFGTAPNEEDLIACMPRDPNPYRGFRGDPAGYNHFADGTINWENYGAYAPAVASALNDCVLEPAGGRFEAVARRGISYQYVADTVLKGYPVIVWVAKREGAETTAVGPPEEAVRLVSGEHVWVVVGYHEDGTFTIHDPYPQKNGKQVIRVRSFPNWGMFDHMAVTITRPGPDLRLSR